MPFAYVRGHSPGNLRSLEQRGYYPGSRTLAEDIRWMVHALTDHYGSVYAAAPHVRGACYVTLWSIREGHRVRHVLERTRRAIERAYESIHPDTKVPIAPLLSAREGRDIELTLGHNMARVYHRSRVRGWISLWHADEICVAWGTHLSVVYPALYEEETA